MKSLTTNSVLAIISVAGVIALIVTHELLAAIAGTSDRFVLARRWLFRASMVFGIVVAVLIVARFYYLRTA